MNQAVHAYYKCEHEITLMQHFSRYYRRNLRNTVAGSDERALKVKYWLRIPERGNDASIHVSLKVRDEIRYVCIR